MRICAHMNFGSSTGYARDQRVFETISAARDYFKRSCDELGAYWSEFDTPVMDIYGYDDCGCDPTMNFHDYPDQRYELGPRGGVRKV